MSSKEMRSAPWAKTILRSGNNSRPDKVLSTLLVRLPRCVLAELNTHRVFSRNSASTRAIPTQKLIQQVMEDPFIPLVWGMAAKGMQAVGVHPDAAECERTWLKARDAAVTQAEAILALGLHKQIAGRLLEPFMWTIVCLSSTEWSNFLALRDHPDAEPHIAILAREIRKELDRTDNIQVLQPGQWHLPFAQDVEDPEGVLTTDDLIKLSSACCASTSYKTVDGFDMTLDRAKAIFEKLVEKPPLHASPFEHVAQADEWFTPRGLDEDHQFLGWVNKSQHGNFVGFRQFRKMLPNESL